ncbi:MAG TPA: prepilin-type N-terminal cleavage/methylation domain-containing protein [bacterium]|jgi:type II secretory pathway pseudopilin PulG|nr:prepilin-type N-terminal cleavage/methylation domain-containing protein [Bacteroidales bacterium]HQM85227.1 prepilin-type N-terminal cleavage/methylation domain-containing protein [bacterium]
MKHKVIQNKKLGFTMIELMVSIFITLTVIGTFFKLYTNSIKVQRNTAIRSSVNTLGEQMIETIGSSIRLLGLNNTFVEYDPGVGVSGTIIADANGSAGIDQASFRYFSPFGGPITKLSVDSTGTNGACTLTLENSGSLDAGINEVNLIARNGIYKATVTSITGNVVITSVTTPAIAGDCAAIFPEGTVLTGPNNDFLLTYTNGGATTLLRLVRVLPDGTQESLIDFSSLSNPAYQIPYFVLQFMREYDDGTGTIKREWFSEIDETGSPDLLKQVKAVRIGFVLLSDQERVKKKVASADAGITNSYCPFDAMCFDLADQNKTAYVFRRVIHIRNYDYLGINSGITY